jgi:hypothetical protein
MAAFNELTAAARRLYDKVGGHTAFSVDVFDAFIIDEKLAADPETADTTDPRYKGFVQQRGVLKGRIDRAAKHLHNGSAYAIQVRDAGKTWELVPFHQHADAQHKDFAALVTKHVDNRFDRLKALERQVREKLMDDYDPTVQAVVRITGLMQAEAIGFTSKVRGEAARYNAAYERAMSTMQQLAQEAHVDLLIEDQSDED